MNIQSNKHNLGIDPTKICTLWSFAYFKPKLLELSMYKQKKVNWLCDSGAFTIMNSKGKNKLTIDDYIYFLKEHKSLIWKYINFDVIGDAKASADNLQYMRSKGLDPVPVFTRDTKVSAKERKQALIDMANNHEYLMLGGVAGGFLQKKNLQYAVGCARILHSMNKPFHILGTSQRKVFSAFRPTTADSSCAVTQAVYGRVAIFHSGKFYSFGRDCDYAKLKKHERILRTSRLSPSMLSQEFYDPKYAHKRCVINIWNYLRYQKFIKARYNVDYFIACIDVDQPKLDEAITKYGALK